jgi:hypothetical protein
VAVRFMMRCAALLVDTDAIPSLRHDANHTPILPTKEPTTARMWLIVDVARDVRHVRALYLDALGRTGWKPLEQTLRHGGFMHPGPMMQFENGSNRLTLYGSR